MLHVEEVMIRMRRELWEELGLLKDGKKVVEPEVYVNHTWLKKFGAMAFEYDSESEEKYLYFRPGEPRENEYHIDENGLFVPGITKKEEKAKVLTLQRRK